MPILRNNINTVRKKYAWLGGALVLAGAGAWGLYGLNDAEDVSLAPPAALSDNVPSVTEAPKPGPLPRTLKTYTVKDGDTLSAVAALYGIDVDTILSANPNIDGTIYPGDELKILPEKGVFYEVKAGDTLWRIGRDYNLTAEALVAANQKSTDQIEAGESIFIPGARFAGAEPRKEERAQPVVSRADYGIFSWPAGGELSSPFGPRWGRLHAGIDIADETGAPVTASGSGQVIWAGKKGNYGNTVMINHGNDYVTLYGHLDNYFVEKGQYVRKGQRIASVGSTGNSTGPHLHFEVRRNGNPVDPMGMLP